MTARAAMTQVVQRTRRAPRQPDPEQQQRRGWLRWPYSTADEFLLAVALPSTTTKVLAVVLCLLIGFWATTEQEHVFHLQPHNLQRTSHILSPGGSHSNHSISIRSTVTGIDLAAERIHLEFTVQHHGQGALKTCTGRGSKQLQLTIGTAPANAVVPTALLPLCGQDTNSSRLTEDHSSHVYSMSFPVRQHNTLPKPFEEFVAEVQLKLQPPCPAGLSPPRAEVSCMQRWLSSSPSITWTAVWATPGMQVSVERRVRRAVLMLAATAGFSLENEDSVAVLEQLGMMNPPSDVAYAVLLSRSSWLRIIHLSATMVQLATIFWCLLLIAGQVLCAYVMHRFLCSSGHGTHWH